MTAEKNIFLPKTYYTSNWQSVLGVNLQSLSSTILHQNYRVQADFLNTGKPTENK